MLSRIPLLIAILLVAGCETAGFDPVCPTLFTYSPEEQLVAADELDNLPEGSILVRMIGDYGVVRNEIRACQSS